MKKIMDWKELIFIVLAIVYVVYVVVLRITDGSAGIHSVIAPIVFLFCAAILGRTSRVAKTIL